MIWRFLSKKKRYSEIAPDEIFLDSKNLPEFNTQQMEGRLEKPIPHKTLTLVLISFFVVCSFFSFRLIRLQIIDGKNYYEKSIKNAFSSDIIFADRGIIFDRNKIELAWNERKTEDDLFAERKYIQSGGFAHVLGYVTYPQVDSSGHYWQTDFIGKDGVEKIYNEYLKGRNGARLFESDVKGTILSAKMVNEPVHGNDLILSIDATVQKGLYQSIENLAGKSGYKGGAGLIMDIHTGELIASTSYPEYDPYVLSLGTDTSLINSYIKDQRRVFIDRTISGAYTPGSIVKPYMALAALQEGVIDPLKKILSTGQLVLPNPYSPGNDSVFKDNKAHGLVDMRHALAVSSNVYFYEIGGGYKDQKGLGISNIEKYMRLFGIGEKTGIDLPNEIGGTIPSVEWKKKRFPNDPWRIGDTYHTSIGQYGFQVTPIQMLRAVSAVANRGTLVTPHIVKDSTNPNATKTIKITSIDDKNYTIVHEGMRMVVTDGTGRALDVPYVKVAAKSGTAQVGISKSQVNSWITGFFPYENPKYAFVILMERGKSNQVIAASRAMRDTLDYMNVNTPDYFK